MSRIPLGGVARALVLEAPRKLVARDFAIPDTGEDDGLVKVEACGLCGTDHEQYTGELWGGFAFVPGHETVGPRDARRLELARCFGADLAVDVSAQDPVAALREATGRLADVVVDVTAKAPPPLRRPSLSPDRQERW